MSLDALRPLAVPTPFSVGAVNAYLLDGPPLTLVDAGPHTPDALQALSEGIAARGRRLEDVQLLLVTHPHIDHFGLAAEVRRRSGCAVAAHPGAAAKLADYRGYYARVEPAFARLFSELGVPQAVARRQAGMPERLSALARPVPVDRPLCEGDVLRLGALTLDVLETPGHSQASLSFHAAAEGALFAGDHLIEGITPNPLLEPPPDPGAARPRSLLDYLDSLDKVARLDPARVFPGHRGVIARPQAVIAEGRRHCARRSDAVLGLLRDAPATPFELLERLFPGLPESELFLGMSEVVGHLERLEAAGRACARRAAGRLVYAAAETPGAV